MIVEGNQIRHVLNEKKLLNSLKHNFVLGLLTTFQDEAAVSWMVFNGIRLP